MNPRHILLSVAILYLGVVCAQAAPPAVISNSDTPIPPFKDVERAVWDAFKAKEGFKPNDLITQDEVAPLLQKFQKQWLPPKDAAEILGRVPQADGFLAVQLRTPAGRKFMRDMSEYKNSYDRVDRLSRLPRGEKTVRDLIRGPDGYKMIEYMTTTKGGRAMGQQLSNAPGGQNFNSPTGRIYTVPMLLGELKTVHEKILNPNAGKGAKKS
jgi:hypothetical protein